MKLRYKIASTFLLLLSVGVVALAITLSYSSTCGPAPTLSANTDTMKAIMQRCYGSPDVITFEDVEKPVPADDEILVKVVAAAVNPLDWHYVRGTPYFLRLMAGLGAPDNPGLGADYSGIVEAVGSSVTRFKPGDEVFGVNNRAYAEYLVTSSNGSVTLKPPLASFEQAASLPVAAVTALQALRDSGKLQAGQSVLINGASGGVGSFAVQIAKSFGAEVTGICSTRNLDLVRSLGADHVLDYKKEDYTEKDTKYDLILDMVGNHSLTTNRKVLKPGGRFVIVGGQKGNWLGPMIGPLKAMFLSPFVDEEFVMIMAAVTREDLTILAEMMQSGEITPVISDRYQLHEVAAAIAKSEEGHTRGKMIVNVQ